MSGILISEAAAKYGKTEKQLKALIRPGFLDRLPTPRKQEWILDTDALDHYLGWEAKLEVERAKGISIKEAAKLAKSYGFKLDINTLEKNLRSKFRHLVVLVPGANGIIERLVCVKKASFENFLRYRKFSGQSIFNTEEV